ncbi:MAG: hypothetical protein PHQ12_07445 [Chthoniobacteraceae bacterium]|nr:hypothetical protein [Chthoniobacteraceae bacterium]
MKKVMKKGVVEIEKEEKGAENFKLTQVARQRLAAMAEFSGRSKTRVVEDYLLGVRQWPEPLQSWLNRKALEKGVDVDQYVKDLILREFVKDFRSVPQD